jgi:serine/threonine-protein kinase
MTRSPQQLPPGTVLAARYEVGDLLGQGGMSQVYRGVDRILGRPVAVKVIAAPEGSADATALRARLRREAA